MLKHLVLMRHLLVLVVLKRVVIFRLTPACPSLLFILHFHGHRVQVDGGHNFLSLLILFHVFLVLWLWASVRVQRLCSHEILRRACVLI